MIQRFSPGFDSEDHDDVSACVPICEADENGDFVCWSDVAELLKSLREKLDTIAVTEGIDAGVILLSSESPTHTHASGRFVVYGHTNFSPLGDAMVELAEMIRSAEKTS